MKTLNYGMKDMSTIVDCLENVEKNVVEEMKKPLEMIQNKEIVRRKLKDRILEEISEEEKCCLILGFPILTTKRKDVIDGLIEAVMKEDTATKELKEAAEIKWRKANDGTKKSVIIISLGSKTKRNQFLSNVNNSSEYRVRKTVPQRYRDALNELEKIGYVLRKMHPRMIATDYEMDSVTLNLIYRTRKSLTDRYSDWRVKQS